MSDSTQHLKALERQLRRLVAVLLEEAHRNADFAVQLASVLSLSDAAHAPQTQKPKAAAFNPVDILHRQGREALQHQLELRTDTELKEILRQQGLWKRKGEKQHFNRSEAVQNIAASAERRLHQGSSFLQSVPAQES